MHLISLVAWKCEFPKPIGDAYTHRIELISQWQRMGQRMAHRFRRRSNDLHCPIVSIGFVPTFDPNAIFALDISQFHWHVIEVEILKQTPLISLDARDRLAFKQPAMTHKLCLKGQVFP